MTEIDAASQRLSEALTEACRAALTKAGFPPSEKLLDKIHEEIKFSLTLR